MKTNNSYPRYILLLSAALLLGGCATSSLFVSYPSQMQQVKQQIINKQFTMAQTELEKHVDDADKILYMMEHGRTSQIASNVDKSIEAFKKVIEEIKINDNKAKITATGAAQQGSALLTNDNAIPYEGYPYERIFVHQFQAMNYLFSKDLEAALVEVRRANEEQRVALLEHEDEIAEAEEKNAEQLEKNKNFMDSFQSLQAAAGKVKNSFQNAYTFYASGIIYELQGNLNDAYIDYKKALEIFPDNTYLQKDVLRLAKQLSMTDDYERFKQQYKVEPASPEPNSGELIVLFEHGFAPVKTEVKVAIATYNHIHSAAFPTYPGVWQDTSPLTISNDGKTIGATEPIIFVQSLAAKALQEQLPAMMIRQVLRVAAKKEVADQSNKILGQWGGLAANVFNMVSENADRRSWLTLPNDAQIYRGYLPEGEHRLQLNNGKASDTYTVKIVPGKKTILRAIATANTMHVHDIVL